MATPTDGRRAHDVLLSFEPLAKYGYCWYYVWQAYKAAGASTNAPSTPTAYDGWLATQGKHPGDRNPPPGAAIWLGRRHSDGNMAGDVFIAGAYDGDHAATDQPSWGQTGVTSIQGRINLTGREYLGWSDHVLDCPIILGGQTPTGAQRVAGPNGVNGRADPSTSGPPTQFIKAGVVGTFDGWIHGQNVEGNNVWFRGAFSGDWFWSGGFTDTGTHDLADLNPPSTPTQRVAGPNGANGRTDPSTAGPVRDTLNAGAVGTFNGWRNGESVNGNPVWFRGAYSGLWFWSGGFTDASTNGLPQV